MVLKEAAELGLDEGLSDEDSLCLLAVGSTLSLDFLRFFESSFLISKEPCFSHQLAVNFLRTSAENQIAEGSSTFLQRCLLATRALIQLTAHV